MAGKAVPQQPRELGHGTRPLLHDDAPSLESGGDLVRVEALAPRAAFEQPAFMKRLEKRLEPKCVPRGDQVDRVAHERETHRPPALDESRQLVSPKAFEARPQRDVRLIGCLCLHPDEALDHRSRGEALAFQQELTRQEGAVEVTRAHDPRWFGHPAIVVDGASHAGRSEGRV